MAQLFSLLATGLFQYIGGQRRYPLPPTLQQALNMLSAILLDQMPRTLSGVLQTFEQPLVDWWPEETHPLPEEIDKRFGLLDGAFLDDQLIDYLDAHPEFQTGRTSLLDHGIIADNLKMRDLLDRARSQFHDDPQSVQQAYQSAREFIIRHPMTTPNELNSALRGNPFRDLVTDMYLQATLIDPMLRYQENYWLCRCGLLYVQDQRLTGIKPAWCRTNCPGEGQRQAVLPNPNRRVLRRGIQLRTMIPGLAEIELYDELLTLVDQELLTRVTLWPGIDTYDLQIELKNGMVWAVDVKDFRSPTALARFIKDEGFPTADGDLWYSQAFFVVPDQRAQADTDYLSRVRSLLRGRTGYEVLTSSRFIQRVLQIGPERGA